MMHDLLFAYSAWGIVSRISYSMGLSFASYLGLLHLDILSYETILIILQYLAALTQLSS